MSSSNKREGGSGIDFGADFSGLRERPVLKGADLDLPTSMEVGAAPETSQPVGPTQSRDAAAPASAAVEDDPLTRLLTAAERERGLPYTFRIPISMDREFRTLAKEFDLDLSDIARSGLEMALHKLRQMSRVKKLPRLQ